MFFNRICLPVIAVLSLSFFLCKDDSPSSPSARAIDAEDIQGAWYPVNYAESWNLKEDGVPDAGSESEPVNDTSMLLVANASQIISYEYYSSGCYYVDAQPYTLSGNRLFGEEFDGQETDTAGTYSWNTTLSLSGNQLVITYTETMNSTDETGWYKTIITMKRYGGAIPPANWPTLECTGFEKKTVKRFLKRFGE